MSTSLVAIWPDDSWCYADEVEGYMRDVGKSDDYITLYIADDLLDEITYQFVVSMIASHEEG